MISCVVVTDSLTIETCPAVPNGTIAAFATTNVLPVQFSDDTVGAAPPLGYAFRSPLVVISAAVKLSDTAEALAGIPQWPAIVKLRVPLGASAGGPNSPVNPNPRVSATRQGTTAMK